MGFGVDMAKAKELHRKNIRISRAEKFTELDVQFQRAIETNNTSEQASVAAKKQVLRDAPADSADELKAQWKTDILGATPYS